MAKYSYSTEIGEKDAAAVGKALPISTKQAIEICSFIRGKRLERAKVLLDEAINEKTAIPFSRFTNGIGHRKGRIASGRYPKKACTEILKMLNSAQANAQFKGLSSSDLIVRHISPQRASTTWHYGRRRARAKRTNIEVVLTEIRAKKEGATEKPAGEEKKTEEKKEAVSEKKKEERAEEKEKVIVEKSKEKEHQKEAKEKVVEGKKPKTAEKEQQKLTEEKPKEAEAGQ